MKTFSSKTQQMKTNSKNCNSKRNSSTSVQNEKINMTLMSQYVKHTMKKQPAAGSLA